MENTDQKTMWNRLSGMCSRISKEIKEIIRIFPCTIAAILVCTILEVIFFDVEAQKLSDLLYEGVFPFLALFGIGMFAWESVPGKKRPLTIAGAICLSVISLILAYSVYSTRELSFLEGNLLFRCICGYVTILLLTGIYLCYRNTEKSIPDYGIHVFSNLIRIHVIYLILIIGALSICGIICVLFLDHSYFDLIGRALVLVTGFFYLPAWLYALCQARTAVDSFTQVLVKYVMLPLVSLVYLIIYIYIIKIMIQRSIPSNQIFLILTSLFLAAMPTWTMMESIDRPRILCQISGKLPLLFAPLILLQIYSVGVRIWTYGIKPERYLGVLWILLEIVYLLLYWRKRDRVGVMFLVGACSMAVAFLVPFVNMYQLSLFSQDRILSSFQEGEQLTDEWKRKINGAYLYLSELQGGKEAIARHAFTEKEIEQITEYYGAAGNPSAAISTRLNINLMNTVTKVDVSGFSSMCVAACNYTQYNEEENWDLREMKFYDVISMSTFLISVDMEEFTEGCLKEASEKWQKDRTNNFIYIDDYVKEHGRIAVDEDHMLVVNHLNIEYDRNEEKITYLYIEGYLLER